MENDLRKRKSEAKNPIELAFMLRLIIKVGFVLITGALLPALIFWFITDKLVASSYAKVLQNINTLHLALLKITLFSATGQIVLVGVLISTVALFASHKIAGPLIRFQHHIHELCKGNFLQHVQFRRGDQNHSLPDTFNQLCERFRKRVIVIQNVKEELIQIHNNLALNPIDTLSKEDKTKIFNQINELEKKLRKAGTLAIKNYGQGK